MSDPDLPAFAGGVPMFPEGPPQWPQLDPDVREAMLSAWQDGSWGGYLGPHVERLERELANLHRVGHAYCCSSGTLAVELALRGLRVESGDEVVLAGYDFPGNFRAIEATGARPVLVDVAPGTWQLEVDGLQTVEGQRIRAIVVSHLHGCLAPMPSICQWARERGIAIVEDACQAHGAMLGGRMAGTWGDVGVLSFGGSKLMTAGRGGVILTDDDAILQRVKIHCEQGNHAYPLSQLQAAVLQPQLQSLPERNRRRGLAVAQLRGELKDVSGLQVVQAVGRGVVPSFYKAGWWYDSTFFGGMPRDDFIAAAQAEGLAIGPGFPSFTQRSERRCRKIGNLQNSQQAGDRAVLLSHPVLLKNDETLNRVARAITRLASYLQTRNDTEQAERPPR